MSTIRKKTLIIPFIALRKARKFSVTVLVLKMALGVYACKPFIFNRFGGCVQPEGAIEDWNSEWGGYKQRINPKAQKEVYPIPVLVTNQSTLRNSASAERRINEP
jgi:hypothetical protein